MTQMDPEQAFETLVKATNDELKPLGFVRKGSALKLTDGGNCAVIQFQRSVTTSKDRLLFTVNFGVAYGKLLESEGRSVRSAAFIDVHLWERIGALLPGRPDKWWEIKETTHVEALRDEVLGTVRDTIVPYIKTYLNTDAVIALWESGQSPGLTEVQRVRFLSKLRTER